MFSATLTIRDSAGARASARRVVVVVGKNHVVFKPTTLRLGSGDLRAIDPMEGDREALTLTPGVIGPSIGRTLLFPAGSLSPRGLAVVVDSVGHDAAGLTTVLAHDASLSDIYSTLTFAGSTEIGNGLRVTRMGRYGPATYRSAKAVPFKCDTSGDKSVNVTADLTKTAVSPTIDLTARIFQLDVVARPVFSLGVDFSGSAKCSLGDYFALNFPIPEVPGLVISISPYFTLEASGRVSADVSWHPAFFMDLTQSPARTTKFLQFNSTADASGKGSASVTLEGGLDLQISVAKRAGLDAKLGPKITAVASLSGSTADSTKACIDVTSAIDASVTLFANVLFTKSQATLYSGEFFKTQLVHKCGPTSSTPSGSGTGSGTSSGGGGTSVGASGNDALGPPSVSASNNGGEMAVQLSNFPPGTTYFFCHSGDGSGYPTGGSVLNHGNVNVTAPGELFPSGLCSGSGTSWIGLQATDGHDYYSNQVTLAVAATPSVSAANNNGQMAVQLSNFPLGTTYFFCHSADPSAFPTGGVVTNHGQVNVTSPSQSFSSGLCAGRGNAWIGLQATDGHDYYSNQVNLEAPATPGASLTAGNNNGEMTVQLTGFPQGTTYYFCHSGDPSAYPTGGVITSHGQFDVASSSQSFSSGLCSGRGNAWIGLQATDGHDYYSNQVDLYAPATPGAAIAAFGASGQLSAQVTGFPLGTTYWFCHAGDPSQYPTGGAIIAHSQFDVTSPDQTFGPLCSGSGNTWIGVQATDGHDYYSNQITL